MVDVAYEMVDVALVLLFLTLNIFHNVSIDDFDQTNVSWVHTNSFVPRLSRSMFTGTRVVSSCIFDPFFHSVMLRQPLRGLYYILWSLTSWFDKIWTQTFCSFVSSKGLSCKLNIGLISNSCQLDKWWKFSSIYLKAVKRLLLKERVAFTIV